MRKENFEKPEQEPHLTQLEPVSEHHKLGKDGLWATIHSKAVTLKCSNTQTNICSKVVELPDQKNIQHSSIDLVHFSWVEESKDIKESGGDEDNEEDDKDDKYFEDVNIKAAPTKTVIYCWLEDTCSTFRVDQDLHAVTAHNILFHEDEGNHPHSHCQGHSAPRGGHQ